jgi:6-phosphogluconolactonase
METLLAGDQGGTGVRPHLATLIHKTLTNMKTLKVTAFAGALALALTACQKDEFSPQDPAAAGQDLVSQDRSPQTPGFVYTLSNQVSGNSVLRYARNPNGTLDPSGSYPTAGNGSGGGLGSQGALVLSTDGKWLFAVNAGSDNVTVLRVQGAGLTAVCIAYSGGVRPISLTQHGSLLYVLNAGGTANITGFRIEENGGLTLIDNSTRLLSTAAPAPAQISFNQHGTALIVTEKATNSISSFTVNGNGLPGMLHNTPSAGQTPFGFSLGKNDRFFVTEAFGGAAGQSTVSTYSIDANANVTVIDGLNALGQGAACWAVTTNNGKTVLTTNTASGNMSSLSASASGDLSLLQSVAGDAGMGSGPIDASLSKNSKYLYVLETNTHAISAYALGENGTLTQVDEELGLPIGTVGLAAK